MSVAAIKSVITRALGTNLNMTQRARYVGLTAGGELVLGNVPGTSEKESSLLGSIFSLEGALTAAAIGLSFVNPLSTLGIGLFTFLIGGSLIKAGEYGIKALGNAWDVGAGLLSFDFGRALSGLIGLAGNLFAGGMYAVSALPVGKLFSVGLKPAIAAIQRMARFGVPQGEATAGRYVVAGAQYLYGRGYRLGLQDLGRSIEQRTGQFAGATVARTGATRSATATATAEAEGAVALGLI